MYVSHDDDAPDNVNVYEINNDRFVFNKYKTSNTYGKQIQDISEEDGLLWALNTYLKHHPLRQYQFYPLLVSRDGKRVAGNHITRVLNKIFGKKVGSSMLRHIFLSTKFGSAVADLDTTTKAMAHSIPVAINEYIKG
jgi:hypothetical protein